MTESKITLEQEMKTNISKQDITTYVKLWEEFHNHVVSLKGKDISKEECLTILRKFRDACSYVWNNWCVVIRQHPDKEQRGLNCPFREHCVEGGVMKGHRNYCEIAGAAREFDCEKVKKLLDEISDDSLIKIKSIEVSW